MEQTLRANQRGKGYHWYVVGTVCIGAFMAALDASIINVALPMMKRDFHTHMQIIEWVSLSYILTLAALLIPFSHLSDMVGRRRMYSFGFAVFIVGSFLCGLAPVLWLLFVARVLQAVGAAMLQANSVAIITAATPSEDRGKAIGLQASAQGLGLSLGPLIGGVLITWIGWRWIFYVNVPIGLAGTLLGLLILPRDKTGQRLQLDLLGSVFLAPALIAVIYMLNTGDQAGWTSPAVVLSYIVAIVGFLAFSIQERRSAHPMLDVSLLRNRTFVLGNVAGLFSFAVMYAVLFLAPFYLDNVHRMTAFTSGLYLTAIPVGMTLVTPIAGVIADKVGAQIPLLAGMSFTTVGCAILSLQIAWFTPLGFLIGLFMVGLGMGLFTPPNNSQVMGSVPPHRFGITGGVLNMSRTMGMGLGVTLGGLSYQWFLRVHGAANEASATPTQMVPSFRDAYLVIVALAAVVLVLSLLPRRAAGDNTAE